MGGDGQRPAHVLSIPSIGFGHITPLLKFSKDIARQGVIVTFAAFEDSIARIIREDSSLELQSLGFRFINLPQPEENVIVTNHVVESLLEKSFRSLMGKLLDDKISGIPGPTAILSDMFLSWTQGAADQLQIPRYVFIPSGAIFARLLQGCAEEFVQDKLKVLEAEDKIVEFDGLLNIPGLPPLHYQELPISARRLATYFEKRCLTIWQAAGVLVNTFDELEANVLEAWRKPGHPGFEKTKVPKIYPIGPLEVPSATVPNLTVVGKSEDSGSKGLRWLASQPHSSVLYVAFGSAVFLSPETIQVLAFALDRSDQRFLWVLPERKDGESIMDILPSGFLERVGDRGYLYIGWAPQAQILGHSSTSGFLTHAGWNSCLESVAMGLPMITCPQGAEQHLNSRYMVDKLKIAYELRAGSENILKPEEVERVIRLLMAESEETKAMRGRVTSLKLSANAAVSVGGSRWRAVEEFVTDLLE